MAKQTYRYFTHEMDAETNYCTRCGRFLKDLQEHKRWAGGVVLPACIDARNVVAISHRVRKPEVIK